MRPALVVEAVSKRFRVDRDRPTTLRERVLRPWTGQRARRVEIWALRDVSFCVERGRALGIVGHNGAGKSTLLRLLCGVGRPTRGRVVRSGAVAGLLELGGGFHPDLSGRENILTAGILNGLPRSEVQRRTPAIVEFAELEEAIDLPLRSYSSGMFLRLAFAVALELEPETLVIDEILAVGDARFQQKCLERIARFRAAGKTLVLTSHVPEQIRALCDEVLVLEEGRVMLQDAPEPALRCYSDLMRQRTERRLAAIAGRTTVPLSGPSGRGSRQGTQEAVVEAVRLCDAEGRALDRVVSGQSLAIELDYRLGCPVDDFAVSLGLYTAGHVKCWEMSLSSAAAVVGPLGTTGTLRCSVDCLALLPGSYAVNVGLYPPDFAFVYDYHWDMHVVWVHGQAAAPGTEVTGVIALAARWSRVG